MSDSNVPITVKIAKNAVNSVSSVKCDTIILDRESKSDTIPTNIIENNTSNIEHEATVSKISKEKLFYLMSRGITEEKAKDLLIKGFLNVDIKNKKKLDEIINMYWR